MGALDLPLILLAAFVATASPGPATLAIAGTSMAAGPRHGLALAAGVTTGSWTWSIAAATGLSAVMLANAWTFELLRLAGAAYLLWLAVRSARAALRPGAPPAASPPPHGPRRCYAKGLVLHLTNPKAILFFGALFAMGVPPDAPPETLAAVVAAVGLQSLLVFHGLALVFASPPLRAGYVRLRRLFEGLFALAFGAAAIKVLTTRTSP